MSYACEVFIIYLFVCACVLVPVEAEKRHQIPQNRVTKLPCADQNGCLELIVGASEEHHVLLNAEPSLHPLKDTKLFPSSLALLPPSRL